MAWTRALAAGSQEGTPLAYGGVLYMPNPSDVIQAIDAVTGDLRWEYRRELPDDIDDYVNGSSTNRNIAIYGNRIIDTGADNYLYALDAETGRLAWETQILDYLVNPARHSSGPIVAGGKAISGRSCRPHGAGGVRHHPAVRGAEHGHRRHRVRDHAPDAGAAPERGQQPVRVRPALTTDGGPSLILARRGPGRRGETVPLDAPPDRVVPPRGPSSSP